MRGAVIDAGSYTFHAVVADVDEYGLRRVLFEHKTHDRTRAALAALVEQTRARGPADLRVIATCDDIVGVERVSGEDQARLSWLGISSELAGSHGELAVVDLGGGSLELATGRDGSEIATSLPLGVLALRGASAHEVRRRVHDLVTPIANAITARRPDTISVTSGTARALVRLARRLGLVSDLQRHVGTRTFFDLARRLAPLDASALRTLGVPSARRDTVAVGAVTLATLLEVLGRPVVYVAASGMREGALVELAREARAVPLRRYAIGQ